MGKVYKFSVMLALALLMGATVPHVSADPCGDQPCERAEPPGRGGEGPPVLERWDGFNPGRSDRDSFKGDDLFQGRKFERRADRKRKRQRRQIEIFAPQDDDEGRYVQYNEQNQGLIGPTEALTQALAAVPGGKALGVKLLKGETPMYAVKLRVRGKVRRILVDARTAQILGE
jgi:uncharacterized membrane protein YkoI